MITTPSSASRSDPSLRFGAVIQDVFEMMHAEFGDRLTSVLVGGSASRNTARDDSDLDVFVTFSGDWRQRRRLDVRGREIDLFIHPTELLRLNIEKGRDPVLVYNYADGWPIFDPTEVLEGLQALARRIWSSPRPAPTELQIFVHGNKLRDGLASVRAAFGAEPAQEAYLMCDYVESAVAAFFCFTRRWRPPQKTLMAELQLADPHVADQIAIALDQAQSRESRDCAITSIYDAVIARCEAARHCSTGPKLHVSVQGQT